MKILKQIARRGLLVASAAGMIISAAAVQAGTLSPWSFSGTGTTNITTSGSDVTFDYATNQFNGTYTATTTVLQGGEYTFDWTFAGFHSWFNPRAFLNSSVAGVSVPSTGTFGSFSFTGTETVNLTAGDVLTFTFGGSHFDRARSLYGSLALQITEPSPVPLPASAFMLLAGVGAIGAAKKRKKRAAA